MLRLKFNFDTSFLYLLTRWAKLALLLQRFGQRGLLLNGTPRRWPTIRRRVVLRLKFNFETSFLYLLTRWAKLALLLQRLCRRGLLINVPPPSLADYKEAVRAATEV